MELSGLETVDAAVAAVVQVLTDPATAEAGAQLIAAGARPLVPVDKGTLLASERVLVSGTGAQLVYAARHAVFVQASQPWLGEGITRAVDQLVDLYATRVLDAWT